MATRCTFGYEMSDGTYRATYVHYDGYPNNMRRTLKSLTRDQVELFVTEGWLRGGIRSIDVSGPDYFNDPGWEGGRIHTSWPERMESYAYMLKKDSSWVYTGHDVDGEQAL